MCHPAVLSSLPATGLRHVHQKLLSCDVASGPEVSLPQPLIIDTHDVATLHSCNQYIEKSWKAGTWSNGKGFRSSGSQQRKVGKSSAPSRLVTIGALAPSSNSTMFSDLIPGPCSEGTALKLTFLLRYKLACQVYTPDEQNNEIAVIKCLYDLFNCSDKILQGCVCVTLRPEEFLLFDAGGQWTAITHCPTKTVIVRS